MIKGYCCLQCVHYRQSQEAYQQWRLYDKWNISPFVLEFKIVSKYGGIYHLRAIRHYAKLKSMCKFFEVNPRLFWLFYTGKALSKVKGGMIL